MHSSNIKKRQLKGQLLREAEKAAKLASARMAMYGKTANEIALTFSSKKKKSCK